MPADTPASTPLDADTLARVGEPIAAGLLPAWRVTWRVLTRDKIDALDPKLPGPNLAIVQTMPERRLATVNVVTPWPAGESLSETLHHELGHAWIAPITAQIPDTAASVMLEEQLVETLGVYLATLSDKARAAARRALAPIVEAYAPRLRARISASAGQRARGGQQMDPNLVKQALDALEAGDGAKCAELLKGLIASAASGAPAHVEPDGDEAAKMAGEGVPQEPKDATPGETLAAGRAAARKENTVSDIEIMRARKALAAAKDEAEAITAALRVDGKTSLVTSLRARLADNDGLPALERDILDAPTFQAAKTIHDIAIKAGGGVQRARSGIEHGSEEPTLGAAKAVAAAELVKEGFDGTWIKNYENLAKRDPAAAAAELDGGREFLRARKARQGGAS